MREEPRMNTGEQNDNGESNDGCLVAVVVAVLFIVAYVLAAKLGWTR